ncbi:unnamed protein product, partial [Brenthis ino]
MDINQLVYEDQSIKIVPSVEESLKVIGLNVDLDERTLLWFNQLKDKWKTWKKSPAVDQHFETFFQSTPDPYRVALVCLIKCDEFKDCKPKTLPFYISETLSKWSQSSGLLPEESLKLPAFQIAIRQRNQHFLNLIIKTYKVYTIKETILPTVKDMIKNDNCKQASQIVIAMELFDDIPVQDLLFPLILQDKPNMIDEYLSECPNQVRPLLSFLDKLLDKNFSIKEYAQKYIMDNRICNVKYDKIHYKPLGKLVARLCNKFNIPVETCKNLSKNRTSGGLRYLIYQKYVEHNISSSVWDDLVKDSLQNSAECAQEFIDMLTEYDTNEALKWASYFQLPENSLPSALKNLSLQEAVTEDENWDTVENVKLNYYRLPISENNIIIINTTEQFYDLVTSLLSSSVVSIDCEWKPSFGAAQSQVALMQIATFDYIYLIDTLILNNKQYTSFWYRFNKSLLDNAEIIKLGFGLEQDLREIKASINGLGSIKIKGEGFLDLSLLWKSLINIGLSLPSDSDSGGNSLSSLVQACFGLPLEKAEQCSNWELRPLRSTQIYYAALDAYVLLEIYKHLQKLCKEQNINFEEVCNDVMLDRKLKSTKKMKVVDRLQASMQELKPKNVNDIKILVEPELSNLLAYFRYCGIDTIVTSPTMLWHDTVHFALSENRIILTGKLKFSPSVKFSQHLILDLGKGTIKEQVKKTLSKYNIVFTQSDLLSRCLCCNLKDLKELSPNEVQDICNKYKLSGDLNPSINRHVSDNEEDDYYENFLSDSDGEELFLYQPVNSQNRSCYTSKGAVIDISDVDKLSQSYEFATLCESCGKLYWDGDPSFISVKEVVTC